MQNGFISIHRKIQDNPFYSNPNALAIWLECLLRASWSGNVFYSKRQKVELKKGQFVFGFRELGEKFSLSESTVRYWMKEFEVEGMVKNKRTNKGTISTIQNWDKYQVVAEPVKKRKRTDEGRKKTINKANKENKANAIPSGIEKSYGNEDINSLLRIFEEVMGFPSSGSKDRFMAKHLLNNFNQDQLRVMMIYCSTNEYAPRVGSLEKLWYKRGDVVAGIKTLQNKSKPSNTLVL